MTPDGWTVIVVWIVAACFLGIAYMAIAAYFKGRGE
jgi:hypothetical protein